jgi:hypothetical protein
MPHSALRELASLKFQFGPEAAARKGALLRRLATSAMPTAGDVLALHELLCFWRAYPDDRAVLAQVEAMLASFGSRRDLRRHRADLQDSGVVGTEIRYLFFAQMAQWVAARWAPRLRLDWDDLGEGESLAKILNLLGLYSETPGLDEFGFSTREWLDRLRGPDTTDGAFLVGRIAELDLDPVLREYFYEHLQVPMILDPADDGPSRTRAKLPGLPVRYQRGPLNTARPDLPAELRRAPARITALSARRGQAVIDLAREAMVTRSRDLDAFAYGDPHDVRLIDGGDGLVFAAIGLIPERRLMFEAVYGFLTLKNGVPIGYVLSSALLGSVEVAYNVFETYRGGEAGHVYGRLLASLGHLFAADTFTVYPYQLGGDGNDEGLQSGAWWFYQKLGFRARDPRVLRLMKQELAHMKRDPRHRSSLATLAKLATENVFYDLGRPREDIIGRLSLGEVGLRITAYLAGRFGAHRRESLDVCARDAAARLGVAWPARWSAGERLAWQRWAPLVLILPGISRWSPAEKRALAAVIRAKGGRRESDFVALFDGHRKLRRAIVKLARGS